ncbi:MAG: lipopolysaccharide heptosyltransferase II [Acidobacteriota bacterium]
MRIAVRAPNWIGDSILSIPSMKSLKTNFPGSSLTIVAKNWVKDIFLNLEFVDDIIVIPDKNDLKSLAAAAKELKKHKFDVGLLLTNSFGSALLFYMAGIPERWGYKKEGRQILLTKSVSNKNHRKQIHQIQYYQNIISGLGLETIPPEMHLSVTQKEKDLANEFLLSFDINPQKKRVILNPGAFYGPSKRWPVSKYRNLAEILQRKFNPNLIIIGSSAEVELANSISAHLGKNPINLAGKTTLRMLTGVISLTDVVVSNDSGPMHLSNALGIPVVALFGPTIPAATRPFHQPYKVIKKEVPCWPCSYRECPYDHQCMLKITPQEVASECEKFIS